MNIYEKKYHQFLAYGMLINERGNLFDSLIYFSEESFCRQKNTFFLKINNKTQKKGENN
jgi:hypothetical protein